MVLERCKKCKEYFIVTEYNLQLPGTKEQEDIICPYCGNINDQRISNGWWNTRKLTDEERKKLKL